jgi:hypothetical protein
MRFAHRIRSVQPNQCTADRFPNYGNQPARGYPQSTHLPIMGQVLETRNPVMPKTETDARADNFHITPKAGSNSATVTDKRTGKTLPLRGYGELKGQFTVRKGVDLTKPISEQAKQKLRGPTLKNKPVGSKQPKK